MPGFAEKIDGKLPAIRLADTDHSIEVSIAPGFGNRAFEMKAAGQNILYFPFDDPSAAVGVRFQRNLLRAVGEPKGMVGFSPR